MATRYGTTTRMKAGDVLKETVRYFGPEGIGLEVESRTLTSVRLVGGDGYVEVHVRVGPRTDVDIVIHEWQAHVAAFLRHIKK